MLGPRYDVCGPWPVCPDSIVRRVLASIGFATSSSCLTKSLETAVIADRGYRGLQSRGLRFAQFAVALRGRFVVWCTSVFGLVP